MWTEYKKRERKMFKGIFHACQVGSGLKRSGCVPDTEVWDSCDNTHWSKKKEIFIHLSPVCWDDGVYQLYRLLSTLPAAVFMLPFLSSPAAPAPLGSFYHHKVITESLFPTFYVFGHLPPPLICKRSQPLSQQMWAYWRSVLTTWGWVCWKESRSRRCEEEMSQGDTEEVERERERDALPDAGPPPDSHWPRGRGQDDGGSSPRPRAEPAARRAAGLSGGEETAADEKT